MKPTQMTPSGRPAGTNAAALLGVASAVAAAAASAAAAAQKQHRIKPHQ